MTTTPNAPTPRDVISATLEIDAAGILRSLHAAGFAVVPVGLLTEAAGWIRSGSTRQAERYALADKISAAAASAEGGGE